MLLVGARAAGRWPAQGGGGAQPGPSGTAGDKRNQNARNMPSPRTNGVWYTYEEAANQGTFRVTPLGSSSSASTNTAHTAGEHTTRRHDETAAHRTASRMVGLPNADARGKMGRLRAGRRLFGKSNSVHGDCLALRDQWLGDLNPVCPDLEEHQGRAAQRDRLPSKAATLPRGCWHRMPPAECPTRSRTRTAKRAGCRREKGRKGR